MTEPGQTVSSLIADLTRLMTEHQALVRIHMALVTVAHEFPGLREKLDEQVKRMGGEGFE